VIKQKAFLAIWIGQVVSILGSSLSGFALGVWIYQETGSASNFALVALCTVLPQLLVSPLAGGLVDRYSRRWMMIVGDSGAGLCTLVLALLFFSGQIQPWQIYLMTIFSSACGALQTPAYSALIATAIRNEQLGRANGLIQFGHGLAELLSPALAGVLVVSIGVPGVLFVDLASFVAAVTTLLLVRLPEKEAAPDPHPGHSAHANAPAPQHLSWSGTLRVGWAAIQSQPSLVALLRFQAIFSFLWSLFGVLVTPMILGFSDPQGLGLALAVAGSGLLIGSLVMSAWGGPRRRLRGLLGFELVSAAAFVLMGARPELLWVAAAAFLAHGTLAFVSSLNESLWQSQVESSVLGRVLALRQTAVKAATLLAYVLAGALADHVLEPLLRTDGILAPNLGVWIGTGPGRGIAALFILIGVIKALTVLWVSRVSE
jgi:MFS family permease